MGLWNWLWGGKEDLTPKVTFQDKDRIEPTLQMIDETKVAPIVMPPQEDVKSVTDLPSSAPFNHTYQINGQTWCWDGDCWVNNGCTNHLPGQAKPRIRKPLPVRPTARQVTQRSQHASSHRISDPHPTDNGMMTAIMMSQILSDDSGSSTRSSGSSSHSRHDDPPSHHDTPSGGYDSGYDGGGGFSD